VGKKILVDEEMLESVREALSWISDCYRGDDDEVGECASCHERSYDPHSPDCRKQNAIAAIDAALAEPDAKREPATEKQVAEVFKLSGAVYWGHYRDGWRAAERFHGITKEVKP